MDPLSREAFEYWLADMDDALERFMSTLPDTVRSQLDYSIASLDVLEDWILEKYASNSAMREPTESRIVDGLARYVGETLRKNIGGHWDIELENKKDVYYGMPQLTGFSPTPTPECPLRLVTTAASRRTGNFMSTILENMKRRYGTQKKM